MGDREEGAVDGVGTVDHEEVTLGRGFHGDRAPAGATGA
jgi:hypothetical protein